MKKNNKKLDRKTIIVPILSLIAALLVVIPLWLNTKDKKDLSRPILIGTNMDYIDVDKDYIFTSFSDFKNKTNSDVLSEDDFSKNNYVLVEIVYDGCGEDNIEVDGYKLDGNSLKFYYTYESSCGVCAPIYDYYLVKIDKDITSVNVDIKAIARNKAKCDPYVSYKPLIYMYPEEKTDVTVRLGYPEKLTSTYPKYNNEWKITAYPNGDLKDSNNTYYGLYWEGVNNLNPTFEDGFVVKKDDVISFLEEKLTILGLNDKERNEFIIYWLPKLEENEYNLIRFESIDNINKDMPLIIDPKPDTIIRVLMEFKSIDKEITIKEQKLTTPKRTGFTVVEWGGTIVK